MNNEKTYGRATTKRRFAIVLALILAFSLCLSSALGSVSATKWMEAQTLGNEGMFTNPFTSLEEALAEAADVHQDVVDEGTTLLKNDGILPLSVSAGTNRITLFNANDFLNTALSEVGYKVNSISGIVTELTKAQQTSVDTYNDVAVLRINRTAGEANDLSTGRTAGNENYGKITWINEEGDIVAWNKAAYEAGELFEAWPDGTPKGWNHANLCVSEPLARYDTSKDLANRDLEPVRHSLMLTLDEEKMFQMIKKNFDKIIVIYDSITQFELYDLAQDDQVAAIIVSGRMSVNATRSGNPSLVAAQGVARVIDGEVNPSSGLISQWDKDMTADPTWQNFGDNFQNDSSTTYMYSDGTSTGSQVRGSIGGGNGLHGVDYEEGIYLGYKYYETYWFETMKGNTEASVNDTEFSEENVAAANAWHESAVAYPFGYGLSYTSFDYEIVKVATDSGVIADGATVDGSIFASSKGNEAQAKTFYVSVKITNTGNLAGKAIAQIYVAAPYVNGGVEKPYVKLVGFEKTKLLAAGQSETLLVKVEAQDVASFDYDDRCELGSTGYILDEGEYTFYAMNSSSVLRSSSLDGLSFSISNGGKAVSLGLDDYSGNEIEAILSTPNTEEYTIRDTNIMAAGGTGMTILSRGDLDGTFPVAPTYLDLKLDDNYIDDYVRGTNGFVAGATRPRSDSGVTSAASSYKLPAVNGADAWYYNAVKGDYDYRDDASDSWFISREEFNKVSANWTQTAQSVRDNDTTGAGAAIKLREMSGVPMYLYDEDGNDYINPAWDTFMNQLTYLELQIITSQGNSVLARIDSIDKNRSSALDNTSSLNGIYHWGDQPLLSRTWSKSLCEQHGMLTACYAKFGKGAPTGWWSPGCNLQRSPFSGRNGDYYGQDALQAGLIIAAVTGSAERYGLACWIKHFVLNDQESFRNGYSLFTWADEQTMRENYFAYPQKAMQEGGSQGYMQSFARIGGMMFANSYAANTVLVKDQWGWTGISCTDMLAGHSGPAYAVPDKAANWFEQGALGEGKNPDKTKNWTAQRPVALDQLLRGAQGIPDGNNAGTSIFKDGKYINTITVNVDGKMTSQTEAKVVSTTMAIGTINSNPISGIWSEKMENGKGGVYLEYEAGSNTAEVMDKASATMTASGWNQWYNARITAMRCCYESANSLGNNNGMLVNDASNELRNYHNTTTTISGLKQLVKMDNVSVAIEDETYGNSVVYSVVNGSLPAGLSINLSTGVISGTPEIATTESIELVVECRIANYLYGNKTVVVEPIESAADFGDAGFTAIVGEEYATVVSMGVDGAKYSIDGILPAGLEFNAEDATLIGTPTEAGVYNFVLNAEVTTGSGRNVKTVVYSAPITFIVEGDGEPAVDESVIVSWKKTESGFELTYADGTKEVITFSAEGSGDGDGAVEGEGCTSNVELGGIAVLASAILCAAVVFSRKKKED